MSLVNENSLAATLDSINEAFFYNQPIPETEKIQTAQWIADRQGRPGAYASMFAPTRSDFEEGVRLFTGERLHSRAGTAHILGEEACRALILLDVQDNDVRSALDHASHSMMDRLKAAEENYGFSGFYCCGTCTPSLWRHLASGGLEDGESRLEAGMKVLKNYRDGKGRWRRFPFYYCLLAISELDLPSAIEEMRYALPVCERYLKSTHRGDGYTQRRQTLVERILAKC
jgi:hypothetical protein